MTGQDAVKAAVAFAGRLVLTGIVLTKMDGDARGGAALSIRAVTNLPIKFVGVGETVEALERFHPDRVASRILGMGDVVSFVERAQAAVDAEKATELAEKLARAEFTLEDFRDQLRQVREMGPMEELLAMLPGGGRSLGAANMDDGALVHAEAMINSMTPNERFNPHIIDGSRRRRIARGSGTSVQEVNRLLKQFFMTRKLMKRASRGSMKQVARALGL
jgi:signal recognition particle subunit SRP54